MRGEASPSPKERGGRPEATCGETGRRSEQTQGQSEWGERAQPDPRQNRKTQDR